MRTQAGLSVAILGPLVVEVDGVPVDLRGPQLRALLVRFALDPGRIVPMDRLCEDLLGDADDARLGTLKAHVSRVRSVLREHGAASLLQTAAPGYRLDIDPSAIDATRFEQLAKQGQQQLALGQHDEAADLLREALALWRGSALVEVVDRPFATQEARRLEERRLVAIEDKLEAEVGAARPEALAGELEALVHQHPLRERLWGLLMLAQYRGGRQADALRTYQRARERLVEELGIEPGPVLRELEAAIIRQDPNLLPVVVSATPRSPLPEPMADRIKVLLVDDHPMWRGAVRSMFDREPDIAVVGEADDVRSAVVQAAELRPDVVLMDLQLGDGLGSDAARQVLDHRPQVRVLMLSATGEKEHVLDAVRAGAVGYVLKTATPAELLEAVRRAAAGEAVFTGALAGMVLSKLRDGDAEPAPLGPFQRSVLRQLSTGSGIDDVASEIGCSASDVLDVLRLTLGRLQGSTSSAGSVRMLKSILFVDIVDSIRLVSTLGDNAWRQRVEEYYEAAAEAAARHGGTVVTTIGDGVLLAFNEPSSALGAAVGLRQRVADLGLEVRIGIHAGECEVGADDIQGTAVHLAARVVDVAEPGEVLVTNTIRDLLLGSSVAFDDRGTHSLKGISGTWNLYRVTEGA